MRLISFNIQHGCADGPGRRGAVDLHALRLVCAAFRADVLALQEVDVGTRRVGGADLAGEVAEACGMTVAFAPTVDLGPGKYGNALLVRGSLEDVERVHLPAWPGAEPRGALLGTAVLEAGARLSVAACHLGLGRQATEEAPSQLATVAEMLAARPAPRALLGDLNLVPGEVAPVVEKAGFVLAGGPATHPAQRPSRRIDHVAVAGLTVNSVEVPRTPLSDHRPLVVDAVATPL